jgi:AcrR family transcriptional regulator
MSQQATPQNPAESESRLRVLRAAHALFVEHGYKAVSMQQIADAAHIHKATLYHHFASKEALFSDVVILTFEEARREMAAAIEKGGSAIDQLVEVAGQFFARSESDFGRLMTDVHEQISPEHRMELMRDRAYPWELLRQVFVDAARTGELPEIDPVLGVSMFFGLVWGQIFMRKMERITTPLDEHLARSLIEILFAGLRNSPYAVADASRSAEALSLPT